MEFGNACGLTTLNECVLNVELHCISIFSYDSLETEMQELYKDLKKFEPAYFNEHYKTVK